MNTELKQRWFEDYRAGESFEFGQYTVTQEEIIEFSQKYDPQYFHTDPQAAKESLYGGLIASGWMSGAIAMRMMCDHFISQVSGMGSPGVDRLRWILPVRAGDTLHMRVTVTEARRSQSKPDRGVITLSQEMINQHGQVVMSLESKGLHRLRIAS